MLSIHFPSTYIETSLFPICTQSDRDNDDLKAFVQVANSIQNKTEQYKSIGWNCFSYVRQILQ
jgi:hypothetical protein